MFELLCFNSKLLEWISSYLSDRFQKVVFNNELSDTLKVTSGVPQGSHLGPILFNIFINDLPTVISHSSILMYADDVKLFLSYSDYNCQRLLQEDLVALETWCEYNLMRLNLGKCKCMSFFRRPRIISSYSLIGSRLEFVNSFVDLGILMDPKLNFINHINATISKARSSLGFVKRWCKEFNDPFTTKTLFVSLVRPVLEFGCVIWTPYYESHIMHLESVQKQFLLFALKSFNWNPILNLPSYNSRLKLLNIPPLSCRRTMLSVVFMIKLINGDIDSSFLLSRINFHIPSRNLRMFAPIKMNNYRSNFLNNNPFMLMCKHFNDLSTKVDYSSSYFIVKKEILII